LTRQLLRCRHFAGAVKFKYRAPAEATWDPNNSNGVEPRPHYFCRPNYPDPADWCVSAQMDDSGKPEEAS